MWIYMKYCFIILINYNNRLLTNSSLVTVKSFKTSEEKISLSYVTCDIVRLLVFCFTRKLTDFHELFWTVALSVRFTALHVILWSTAVVMGRYEEMEFVLHYTYFYNVNVECWRRNPTARAEFKRSGFPCSDLPTSSIILSS